MTPHRHPPHAEVFRSLATGQPIRVSCTCDIARDHTHLEYRMAHPGPPDQLRSAAESIRTYLASWKTASVASRSTRRQVRTDWTG